MPMPCHLCHLCHTAKPLGLGLVKSEIRLLEAVHHAVDALEGITSTQDQSWQSWALAVDTG